MITSINQPHYLPYIGYFTMIANCDSFVFHDDVDFIKGEWKNRNRIRMNKKSNEVRFITVPIQKQKEKKINKLLISYEKNWIKDHINKIKNTYSTETYFKDVIKILNDIYDQKPTYLGELNIKLILKILKYFDIKTKIFYSSSFNSNLKKTDKLVLLCEKLSSKIYIANNRSRNYIEPKKFEKKNIELKYQNYKHPTYKQNKNKFLPFLSIVDLIAYHGKKGERFFYV